MTALAPSAESLLESARNLRPLIEADAAQIERDRRITPRAIEALRAAGLFRMIVPRSLGGSELTLLEYGRVMEELAKADASTAWCVGQNSGIGRLAAYLPRQGAEEVFGDPDAILSWGNGAGAARRVEGGYVVNLRASTSSGMHHATWLGSQDCDMYDERGEPILTATGEVQRCTCFFRPEDVEMIDVWQVSGLRGTGSDNYIVTDLFVPEHRFALPAPLETGPLYLYNTTNIFATGFASVALGIARVCLDSLIEMTASRSQRGVGGTMREQRPIQGAIGRTEATLRSARALLHETVSTGWQRACDTGALDMQSRVELRMATTFAIQRSAEVVDTVYKLAGFNAIFESAPFERHFRDMHAATQHIQARDDMLERVGQYLTGLEPEKGWL